MILDCSKYTGPCGCGQEHKLRTELVVCEYGALKNFDKYMDDCGLSGCRAVIYDTNTYSLPSVTHIFADQEIVLEANGLHSEKNAIEKMMSLLTRKPDYIVTVGGGTITDFGRYSAWKLGIPFVSVPTVISADGFTADTCSVIIDGQKKSIPMQAADAVICDLDVISKAPMYLTVAGIQDIMAKYISIADWKIAHIVSGEYFCEKLCAIEQEALDIMCRCSREIAEGKAPDYEAMAYSNMLSGLTMQIMSTSRAASGAEHLIAHLAEMKPRGFETAHGLHGECVGVGTLMCAKAYHELAQRENIEVKPYEPWDERWVCGVFGPLADGILKENENDVLKSFPPESIRDNWQEIRKVIYSIPGYEELLELYTRLGAKHSLQELGISESIQSDFFDISSAIRNRLTLARMARLIV